MSTVPNAFQSVRPRAAAAPSAAFRPHTPGRAPVLLRGSTPRTLVLDSKGKRCVPLDARTDVAFSIEDKHQGRASTDRRHAIVKGGL